MILYEGPERTVQFTLYEKNKLKEELLSAQKAGGKRLVLKSHVDGKNNYIEIKDKKNNIIAYLIGESAVYLYFILRRINDRLYSNIEVSIKEILDKYCKE